MDGVLGEYRGSKAGSLNYIYFLRLEHAWRRNRREKEELNFTGNINTRDH